MVHIILCCLQRSGLLPHTVITQNELAQSFCLCVCACTCMCAYFVCCIFYPQHWDEIWEETDRFPSVCFICKKKKTLLAIQIYALATSLVLPLSPSLSLLSIFPSLSKWHLRMTRASRVSGAEGRNRGEREGKNRGEGELERERGSKRLSLHISPAPPRRASQPAVCSPLSFLFYHGTEKKINSYFHNPHSCLSTCLCLSPSSHPSPSLFLSPSLSPGVE